MNNLKIKHKILYIEDENKNLSSSWKMEPFHVRLFSSI